MKHICFRRIILVSLLMLISAAVIAAPPAASKTSPLTVQFSLETPKTIVLGEPVILHDTLANPSSQKVAVKLGRGNQYGIMQDRDNIEWMTLSMTGPKGDMARRIPQVPPERVSTFGLGTCGFFDRGDHIDHEIVVTRYLALSKPGDYILTIHVHLPYAIETNSAENSEAAERLIGAAKTVFTKDISIPITVKPADPSALQATAEALTQSILAMKTRPKTLGMEVLIDALCTMPEAQAGPSWQTLAAVTDHRGLPALVAAALARVPSNTSADIMAEVAWQQPTMDAGLAQTISDKLAAMYNHGTPALRTHIKTLYLAHGTPVGETIPMFAVQD